MRHSRDGDGELAKLGFDPMFPAVTSSKPSPEYLAAAYV